jgi:hypothetical protein
LDAVSVSTNFLYPLSLSAATGAKKAGFAGVPYAMLVAPEASRQDAGMH